MLNKIQGYIFAPLKNRFTIPKVLPEHLIYKRTQYKDGTKNFHQWEEFVAFSTRQDNSLGIMVCQKLKYPHRKDYKGPTLGIDYLVSQQTGKNLGSTLVNFAKNYSEQIGCNGYVVLKADSSFTPQRTPHIFYKKMGFGTADKKIDKKLDKLIKNKQDSTHKDFHNMLMFYPPIYAKKESFISTIINKLKRVINL